MSITNFLNNKGFYSFEGHSQQIPQQVKDLIFLTNYGNINVMEIGFNAGHSAEIFLHNNKNLKLISFDLGTHEYVAFAKEYIDNNYPNRHILILGDSRITVPKFFNDNKEFKFDIIFIDGGHDYDIAKEDINNCFNLAHENTIVILDDTVFTKGWDESYTLGPSRVWIEAIQEKKIVELNKRDYQPGRGMSWGRYSF